MSALAMLGVTAALAAAGPSEPPGGGVEGTWRSDGYGMVVKIVRDGRTGRRRLTQYDATAISCLANRALTEGGRGRGSVPFGGGVLTVRREGERLAMRAGGNAADIHLTRAERPPRCPSPAPCSTRPACRAGSATCGSASWPTSAATAPGRATGGCSGARWTRSSAARAATAGAG